MDRDRAILTGDGRGSAYTGRVERPWARMAVRYGRGTTFRTGLGDRTRGNKHAARFRGAIPGLLLPGDRARGKRAAQGEETGSRFPEVVRERGSLSGLIQRS